MGIFSKSQTTPMQPIYMKKEGLNKLGSLDQALNSFVGKLNKGIELSNMTLGDGNKITYCTYTTNHFGSKKSRIISNIKNICENLSKMSKKPDGIPISSARNLLELTEEILKEDGWEGIKQSLKKVETKLEEANQKQEAFLQRQSRLTMKYWEEVAAEEKKAAL